MNRRLLVLASFDAATLLWKHADALSLDDGPFGAVLDARTTLHRAAHFVLSTAPTTASPDEFEFEGARA